MARYGFSGEKLDTKKLILFVLSKLTEPVYSHELSDIVLLDDNADYFTYSDALSELQDGAQLLTDELGQLSLSPRGQQLADITAGDLSVAMRRVATEAARTLLLRRRQERSTVARTVREGEALYFEAQLLDNDAQLMQVRLLVGNEQQGRQLVRGFKKHAPQLHQELWKTLLEDG